MWTDLSLWKSLFSPTCRGRSPRESGLNLHPSFPQPLFERIRNVWAGSQHLISLFAVLITHRVSEAQKYKNFATEHRDFLLRSIKNKTGVGWSFQKRTQVKSPRMHLMQRWASSWVTLPETSTVVFPQTIPPLGSIKMSLSYFAQKKSKYFSMKFTNQLNTVSL